MSDLGRGDFVLPVGTVTLLLLDVEGSTRLWEREPDAATHAIVRLHDVIAEAVAVHGGVQPVEQGEGDSAVAAFARASDAVACALAIQRAPDVGVRIRIGLHTGEVQLRDEGNYIGATVNRCARLRDLGHGGQVLLSRSTHDLVVDRLGEDGSLLDLGVHRLRDLARPEQVFQLCHRDLETDFPPLRGLDISPNNLPLQLTTFIGREDELVQLGKLLQDARLLTATGAGGCGKTRLAQHAAAEVIDLFPDGVWFVDLAPVADPGLVAATLAAVLTLREEPGREWTDTVASHLATRRSLVLLDNCEHVVAAAATLAGTLLRQCPSVVVLATSREPLGVDGEVTWRVPNLEVPDERDVPVLEALASCEAVRLFIDRASRARPNFAVTNETAPAVAQICQRLDGIPLAIVLAAARVRVLSPQQIAAGLDDRFRVLGAGARTAVPRHQTLRACIDVSYDLLGDRERLLFRRLAVFAGGLDLDAAEDVCAGGELDRWQVLEVLVSLVDRSLVVAEQGGPVTRYKLLETIRQYANELLAESGERSAVRDRHLKRYADVVRATERLLGDDQPRALALLDDELDNVRAAVQWSIESREFVSGAAICSALIPYWYVRGMYTEGSRQCAALLEADALGPAERAPLLLAWAYIHAFPSGDLEATSEALERAIALSGPTGDVRTEGRARLSLAMYTFFIDPSAATAPLEQALGMLAPLNDTWWLIDGGITQAVTRGTVQAEVERSLEETREWVRAARRIGDHDHAALAEAFAGALLCMLGRFVDGERTAEAAARELASMGDAVWAAAAFALAAEAALYRGRYDRARELADKALLTAGEWHLVRPLCKSTLGRAHLAAGDVAQAVHLLQQAVDESRPTLLWFPSMLTGLAESRVAMGKIAAARAALSEAVEVTEGMPFDQGRALAALGRLARVEGDDDTAEDMTHRALGLHVACGDRASVADALETLGGVASFLESYAEAARLFGAAQSMRDEMEYVRFVVHRGRYDDDMSKVREGLGAEDFERAWAEGAAMSLEEAVAYAQRGRGERKRPSSGWASLTPTELEVVKLLAEGLTNARIAERLYMAPGTVKTHVGHIFSKLGVSTRSELAGLAARRSALG